MNLDRAPAVLDGVMYRVTYDTPSPWFASRTFPSPLQGEGFGGRPCEPSPDVLLPLQKLLEPVEVLPGLDPGLPLEQPGDDPA